MRGVKAPDYIREFRSVPEEGGVAIKFFSEVMGYQNIGLKLSKTGKLPDFSRKADNQGDALVLLEQWNKWLKEESIHSSGTRKKRTSKWR